MSEPKNEQSIMPASDEAMIDKMPEHARKAVKQFLLNERRLKELGFTCDQFGEWRAANCRVTFYAVFGEWEIDILLANGSVVGCDVPFDKLSGTTRAEIEARRAEMRGGGEPAS
jgi:hypothetical protein